MTPVVSISSVRAGYGNLVAVEAATLEVGRSELVALLGPNGAGKSTTLKVIAGLIAPTSGRVEVDGRSTAGLAPHDIARRGVRLVPEGRGLFPSLSVEEHLLLGAYLLPAKARRERVEEVLAGFPMLKDRMNSSAGHLSGGQQQMLAIARAIMGNPRILMMDEPSLGLAPIIQGDVNEKILELNELGMSILIVEQNVSLALRIAKRAYVMKGGRIVNEGLAADISASRAVVSEYMGHGGDE
jgi:branched-chain amino acid transport system ATP-binding protein